ncbi:DAN domain family member 5 [Aplochiton taeniatus]
MERVLKGVKDFESSGSGPDEPTRGVVKVVKLGLRHSGPVGHFQRGLAPRGAPSFRLPFPAFLARGHPAPPVPKAALSPLQPLGQQRSSEVDLKKRRGLEMWQRAMDKKDHGKMSMSLPINLKEAAKHSCSAVPFTQRVTAEGCDSVTVHNKLCFGQCSSLFVPSGGEETGLGGPGRRPCSRCAPSKARTAVVPLRCGPNVREKRVLLVEECKCETGREEGSVEAVASAHLGLIGS